MPRCAWCSDDPLYIDYYDNEWGVPTRDPQVLFEFLILEAFQAGLSWITVLRKRERYRQVLFGFDPQRLAQMTDAEIDERMLDPGIIRNRRKLEAARRNAQLWLELEDPAGWLWSFVDGQPKINHFESIKQVPAVTAEAEAMSRASVSAARCAHRSPSAPSMRSPSTTSKGRCSGRSRPGWSSPRSAVKRACDPAPRERRSRRSGSRSRPGTSRGSVRG